FFISSSSERVLIAGICSDQDAVSPRRQESVARIDGLHWGKATFRRNPMLRLALTSSSHKTRLRTGAASTGGHTYRTALASSPTGDVCSRAAPTPLGRAGSTAVGPDPPKRPASSRGQRPRRDVDSHAQNCTFHQI